MNPAIEMIERLESNLQWRELRHREARFALEQAEREYHNAMKLLHEAEEIMRNEGWELVHKEWVHPGQEQQ